MKPRLLPVRLRRSVRQPRQAVDPVRGFWHTPGISRKQLRVHRATSMQLQGLIQTNMRNTCQKCGTHYLFLASIKNPADLDLLGFQYGGRGRNRTGVGGFASRDHIPLSAYHTRCFAFHYFAISYILRAAFSLGLVFSYGPKKNLPVAFFWPKNNGRAIRLAA